MIRAKALNRLRVFSWRRLWSKLSFFKQRSKKFANEKERLEYQCYRQQQKAEAVMRYRPF